LDVFFGFSGPICELVSAFFGVCSFDWAKLAWCWGRYVFCLFEKTSNGHFLQFIVKTVLLLVQVYGDSVKVPCI
jgi:hypothetical protein